MEKNMHNFSSRLKGLREKAGLSQTQLAKKLNITRSSVNAWEMSLSAPSILYIVEMSKLFSVTTDFLLGLNDSVIINTDGLTDDEVAALMNTAQCFHNARQEYIAED